MYKPPEFKAYSTVMIIEAKLIWRKKIQILPIGKIYTIPDCGLGWCSARLTENWCKVQSVRVSRVRLALLLFCLFTLNQGRRKVRTFGIARKNWDIYIPKCWVDISSKLRVTFSYFKMRKSWWPRLSWNSSSDWEDNRH